MARSHRRRGQAKTVCLVCVGGVNKPVCVGVNLHIHNACNVTLFMLTFQRLRSACRPQVRNHSPPVVMHVNTQLTGSKQSLDNGDVTVASDDKEHRMSIRL